MKVDNSGPRFRQVPRTAPLGAPTVEAAVTAAPTDLAGDTPATTAPDRSAIRALQLIVFSTSVFIASCVAPDTQHHVIISTREQKLAVLDRGNLMAIYPVSTSKFGLGDWPGSSCTPLGELEIAEKIGDHAAPGTVFKDRRPTGEIVQPDSPGRDPIVTRILWLRGRESQNTNAYARTIYIHGTPEERNIGLPASYGCVRMRSIDIISLYEIVGRGAQVTILDVPLAAVIPGLAPTQRLTETSRPGIVIR